MIGVVVWTIEVKLSPIDTDLNIQTKGFYMQIMFRYNCEQNGEAGWMDVSYISEDSKVIITTHDGEVHNCYYEDLQLTGDILPQNHKNAIANHITMNIAACFDGL